MPNFNINLSRLNGVYKKIAELCDIGENKGTLVCEGDIDEVSMFLVAKKEYDKMGSFNINGKKYYSDGNSIFDNLLSLVDKKNNPAPVDNTRVVNPKTEVAKALENEIDWKGIIEDNFNQNNAKAVASAAKKGNIGKHTGHCYGYVMKYFSMAKMGALTGKSAYMAIEQLRDHENKVSEQWKEIPAKQVSLDDLPDVVLACYDKDDNAIKSWEAKNLTKKRTSQNHPKRPDGYHADHGHIEIWIRNPKTGKFEGYSDGITYNIKFNSVDALFIPV